MLKKIAIIKCRIKAESPLHIGMGRPLGVVRETYKYIPGSVLRGTVGISLIKLFCDFDRLKKDETCGNRDCPYEVLYQEGNNKKSNIYFRPAFPICKKCEKPLIPASLDKKFCKECQKIVDVSIEEPKKCPECNKEDLIRYEWICRNGHYTNEPVNLNSVGRTCVNRVTETAEEGTLHLYDAIDRGNEFCFEIMIIRKGVKFIKEVKNSLELTKEIGLGGSKSRGFGDISIKITEEIEIDPQDLKIKELGEKLKLIILSPTEIKKENKYLSNVSGDVLLRYLSKYYKMLYGNTLKLNGVRLSDNFHSESGQISRWSLKRSKPKFEHVILPCSFFVYENIEPNEEMKKAFAALKLFGIGKKTAHGYGQIMIDSLS